MSSPRRTSSPAPLLLLLLLTLTGLRRALSQPTQSPAGSTLPSPTPAGVLPSPTQEGPVWGCGVGLAPPYRYLCDRRAAWGPVLEALASLGFLLSAGLLLGLLLWAPCGCARSRRQRSGLGGALASVGLSLLASAGLFALTFAFVVRLTPRSCPARLLLFGALFSLAFGGLLARGLALLGFAAARGWGEPALALGLCAVQALIGGEWLLVVVVRDARPCAHTQAEFVALQSYALGLLAVALLLALRCVCRARARAAALFLTALLCAAIWAAWVVMVTWGNGRLGRRPGWDDPVTGAALVASGWVLLLGHGLAQVTLLCREEARASDGPLSFAGWTSPTDATAPRGHKGGRENGSFENDAGAGRGRRPAREPVLRSPYESSVSMLEIDPVRDYSIPRPITTTNSPTYDQYYTHSFNT